MSLDYIKTFLVYSCCFFLILLSTDADAIKEDLSPYANQMCEVLLAQTGELAPIEELQQSVDQMNRFLRELNESQSNRGARAYAFSTPETAIKLESVYGPIISFTTFSRELSDNEHFQLASHILGFMSNLPQGGAIFASGGTAGALNITNSRGGGVGIIQPASQAMGFKTLSITAASAFKYRAAPADYILFSMGRFGSESGLMYELSKALVVIGGGPQAFNEATEYLLYNPQGILVIVDDPKVGGSSHTLLADERFQALTKSHPGIIVSHTGSEAGFLLSDKLGLRTKNMHAISKSNLNVLSANMDYHMLLPGSQIIGFSGWSNFDRSGPDIVPKAESITAKIKAALEHIHQALAHSESSFLYATAGNDPHLSSVPAFESMVHDLTTSPNIRYLAISASELNVDELNSRISAVSFVAPTWNGRTQQLVARIDSLVTAGGNKTVIDQSIQAAAMKRPHIHILGTNTLTDMRIEKLKNPHLIVLTPEQVLELDGQTILRYLQVPSSSLDESI